MVISGMLDLPFGHVLAFKCMVIHLNRLYNTYLASTKHVGTMAGQYSPIHDLNPNISEVSQHGQHGLTMVMSGAFGLASGYAWASKFMVINLNRLYNTYLASRKHLGTIGGH